MLCYNQFANHSQEEIIMKKMFLPLIIVFIIVTLYACTPSKKADIVTTMFVQYDFSKQIVKDKMTVSLLIPPGAEVHSYEASIKDMEAIQEAKLFIFTSLEIDTWIKDPSTIGGSQTIVMNLSEYVHVPEHDHEHDHVHTKALALDDHDDDDHDHDDLLHYWVDPLIAIELIEEILEKIVLIDPANETFYRDNAHHYIEEIHELHVSFDTYLRGLPVSISPKVYFAGHNAMGLFGERYHIEIVSLFANFKPDAELIPTELIVFTNLVKDANTHVLFIEELVEPRAARQIQNELSRNGYELKLLVLHGYHNLSKQEMKQQMSYLDLFQQNINHLKEALTNHDSL